MTAELRDNKYARFLKEQGNYIIQVHNTDWYDYQGFMLPAYLPHCCPAITQESALKVLRESGRPFARWDTRFAQVDKGEWWYVLRRGPWAVENVKDKKKRWMIRQGKKHFRVRPLTLNEVVSECPRVADLAARRYKGKAKVETRKILESRVGAAGNVQGVLEYIGCFYGDVLVSFSENYIQNNAVWLAVIRHDPAFLNRYSSYGLMDGILDYYLNKKKMDYVLDGCRSIHHRTHFQEHLMKVFGFSKKYAIINVAYSTNFQLLVNMAYPFRHIFWALLDKWTNSILDNVSAVLKQEYIRRACEKQEHS
jgi:hypothetical protein